jgi:hypothetical protein
VNVFGRRLPVQYPAARDACLKSMKTDPARFYGPAHAVPLGTGLLVRDCVLATPHPVEVRFETGVGLGLVITHECDVDQNNNRFFNDLVLVCPIISLDDFCASCEEEEGVGAWGGILPAIASDTVYRAMYLPPLPSGWPCPAELEGGGIIYLNHISSSRVQWFTNIMEQAICSLSALGLRSFDFKLQNHLFREKAIELWFGR